MSRDDEPSGIVRFLISVRRWLGGGAPSLPKPREAAGEGQSPENAPRNLPGASTPDEPVSVAPEVGIATATIAERLTILKKSLEFDGEAALSLKSLHSRRDLLLYIHDVILFRFAKLREIGLLNPESSSVVENLTLKVEAAIAQGDTPPPEGGPLDVEELKNENEELRQRIESLHAKYVKSGVISEGELAREDEIRHLQSRLREQSTHLRVARKKLAVLVSYHEMVQNLRAKNSLLVTKLEHQARLMRTLAAGTPGSQELLSGVERLREENRRLKLELGRQSGLLDRLLSHLPAEARQVVEDLLGRNAALQASIEDREAEIESANMGEGDLLRHIERLSEENLRLKGLLHTKESIDGYLRSAEEGKGDPGQLIEMLKMENRRLEHVVREKEEQIKILTEEPSNKQLMQAYSRLMREYKQVCQEGQQRERLFRQEANEKQALMRQVREKTAFIKENQRLKAELETSKRLIKSLKEVEERSQGYRRERAELSGKYEKAMMELDAANRKITKLTAEYNLLVREYENIFTNR